MSNLAFEIEPNDVNTNASPTYDDRPNQRSHSNGISIPNEHKIDDFHDNHLCDNKQFEEELDDINTVQQIHTDITVPPAADEMAQQTSVPPQRFMFLSKIPLVSFVEINSVTKVEIGGMSPASDRV